MTTLALLLDQTQDSFRSYLVLLLLELSPVPGTLYALSQVDFVRISDDTRIDVLHIVPGVCLHVPTRTLCILASESISLSDFHNITTRFETRRSCIELDDIHLIHCSRSPHIVVLFLHVRHVQSRSQRHVHRFPLYDQPTLIEMFVVFLQQPRELLQVLDLMVSNTPPSRTTEESEICLDFL